MNTTQQKGTMAVAKNYKGTPRKVRLLADMVRGKNAKRAIAELSFTNKRHAEGLAKVIQSAVANAINNNSVNPHDLIIADIQVGEGKAMRRHRAGSRGSALRFKRRLSHIEVTVADKNGKDVAKADAEIEDEVNDGVREGGLGQEITSDESSDESK